MMRWKKEEGQAVVEFALILPILILLIFGMIDFGWLFYNKIEVNNASREGARYAAVHWKESNYESDTVSLVTTYASGSTVTVLNTGTEVTVSVSKNVDVLTGVTSTILGDSVNLSASCTMRNE